MGEIIRDPKIARFVQNELKDAYCDRINCSRKLLLDTALFYLGDDTVNRPIRVRSTCKTCTKKGVNLSFVVQIDGLVHVNMQVKSKTMGGRPILQLPFKDSV